MIRGKNVFVEKLGASDKNGRTELFLEEDSTAHSFINHWDSERSISVKTVRLDDYFKDRNTLSDRLLIKMDIEGAEPLALKGMHDILEKNRNLLIVMEFFPDGLIRAEHDPMALFNQLRSLGFNIFTIDLHAGVLREVSDGSKLIDLCGNGTINLLCGRS